MLLPFHHASIRGKLIMAELPATSAGTVFNIQSPSHPSAGRFVRQAVARGFRVTFQAAWPNSAGWVALAAPRSEGVDLIVRYYRDQTFTVQLCRPGLTLDELLPDDEATAA